MLFQRSSFLFEEDVNEMLNNLCITLNPVKMKTKNESSLQIEMDRLILIYLYRKVRGYHNSQRVRNPYNLISRFLTVEMDLN